MLLLIAVHGVAFIIKYEEIFHFFLITLKLI